MKLAVAIVLSLCTGAWAQPGAFVIIAPDALGAPLRRYVEYKQKQLSTRLVSLESLLKGEGVDDPEKVKRFLYAQWKQGTRYALLVGDADVFPVRYMVLDRVTPQAFDYAFYPSDLYYADVARADGSFEDWNAQKDGFHGAYLGEVRGEKNKDGPINFDQIDYKPEVAVGRWPVSTPAEVETIVNKSMAYEAAALDYGGGYAKTAGFVATGGWVENRDFFDKLRGELHTWVTERLYWADKARDDKLAPPDQAHVVQLINSGTSLVLHSGHGADDRWDGSLSVAGLKELHNAKHPTVMISAGCSTARFATLPPYEAYVDVKGVEHKGTNDGEVFKGPPPPPACYQRGKYNPTGLGEQLLRAGPTGAAAYIGCNTGSQPCGLTLEEGFIDALSSSIHFGDGPVEHARLGDCWNHAVAYYYDHEHLATLKPNADWYPPSIFFQGMKFMVFGDPTLELP